MNLQALFFAILAFCTFIDGEETYLGSDQFEIPLFIGASIICLAIGVYRNNKRSKKC